MYLATISRLNILVAGAASTACADSTACAASTTDAADTSGDTNHLGKEKIVISLDEDSGEDDNKDEDNSDEDSSEDEEGEEGEAAKVLARLRPLTAEEEALVMANLKPPWDEQVLVERFGIPMTRRLMRGLEPGTWLNDEIVNYYTRLHQKRDNRLCRKRDSTRRASRFFNLYFMSKLLEEGKYNYARVRRCYRNFLIA